MVINSYHPEFVWTKHNNAALKRVLENKADLSFYYLDFKRLSAKRSQENVGRMKNVIWTEKPDVVVLADDFAMKSLGNFLVEQDIPVVFLGVNGHIRDYVSNTRKVTGVFERPLIKRSVAYIREILGDDFNKCLVVMDNSMSSQVVVQESLKGENCFDYRGTHVDIQLLDTFSHWKKAVLSAKDNGYTVIIMGTYHTLHDDQGGYVTSAEVLRWTSAESPVPVFCLWDNAVGWGRAVGGYVLSGYVHGLEAAGIVSRILDGEKTENITPIIGKKGQLLFSRHELERWGLELTYPFRARSGQIRMVE